MSLQGGAHNFSSLVQKHAYLLRLNKSHFSKLHHFQHLPGLISFLWLQHLKSHGEQGGPLETWYRGKESRRVTAVWRPWGRQEASWKMRGTQHWACVDWEVLSCHMYKGINAKKDYVGLSSSFSESVGRGKRVALHWRLFKGYFGVKAMLASGKKKRQKALKNNVKISLTQKHSGKDWQGKWQGQWSFGGNEGSGGLCLGLPLHCTRVQGAHNAGDRTTGIHYMWEKRMLR